MRGKGLRVVLLAALVAVALVLVVRGARETAQGLSVDEACSAAAAGAWQETLDLSESLELEGDLERIAAECRCAAFVGLERSDSCAEELGALLKRPEHNHWLPDPPYAYLVARMWGRTGATAAGAALAERLREAHPRQPDYFKLAVELRSVLEGSATVLRDLEDDLNLEGGPFDLRRIILVRNYLDFGDVDGARRVLGTTPPEGDPELLEAWFRFGIRAACKGNDGKAAHELVELWVSRGGDRVFAETALAVHASSQSTPVPDFDILAALDAGIAGIDRLPREKPFLEALFVRRIGAAVVTGNSDDALRIYTIGRANGLSLTEFSEEDIRRSRLPSAGAETRRKQVSLRFTAPAGADVAKILLSPPNTAPVDAAWHAVPPGAAVSANHDTADAAPLRWVALSAGGDVVASGVVWPEAEGTTEVKVAPGSAIAARDVEVGRRAADGKRRVAVVILDCGDWRVVQYGRHRRELPFLDHLYREGLRGVLWSFPAFTGAALETVVFPHVDEGLPRRATLALVHDFGAELAGLSAIGVNPFAVVSELLPARPSLFVETAQAGKVSANLLFSHGKIQVGRHAAIVGPGNQERMLEMATSARDLTTEEYAGLVVATQDTPPTYLNQIAAAFDSVAAAIDERDIDLILARVEALDLVTHSNYARYAQGGQDDGKTALLDAYRYVDVRLAELNEKLDDDDILIVMSDHGIRTAMLHDPRALFFAYGGGVAPGRIPGRPHLRGLPRALAQLLGVEREDWPSTGIEVALSAAIAQAPSRGGD